MPKWILKDTEGDYVDLSKPEFTEDHRNDEVIKKITNDRIAIHLGPLISPFKKRPEFNCFRRGNSSHDDYTIDLQKMPNGYPLDSGETVVVASAEYFEFPSDLAGIIISRVGNHLTGIHVGTTFIDAGWPGILTFQITNLDSKKRVLLLGLEIARLFVFQLSEQQPNADREARDQSHHAGITWDKVFNGSRSPFERIHSLPSRDELLPSPTAEIEAKGLKKLKEILLAILDTYSIPRSLPLGLILILLFLGLMIKYYDQITQIVATLKQISEVKSSLDDFQKTFEFISIQIPIKRGNTQPSSQLILDNKKVEDGAIPILITRDSGFLSNIGVKKLSTSISSNNKSVEITLLLEKAPINDTFVDVQLLVFWNLNAPKKLKYNEP